MKAAISESKEEKDEPDSVPTPQSEDIQVSQSEVENNEETSQDELKKR